MMADSFMVLPWIFILFPFRITLPTSLWVFSVHAESSNSFLARLPHGLGLHSSCVAGLCAGGQAGMEWWRQALVVCSNFLKTDLLTQRLWKLKYCCHFAWTLKRGCMVLHNEWCSLLSQFLINLENTQTPALQTTPFLRANQLSIDSHWNKCFLKGQTWGL